MEILPTSVYAYAYLCHSCSHPLPTGTILSLIYYSASCSHILNGNYDGCVNTFGTVESESECAISQRKELAWYLKRGMLAKDENGYRETGKRKITSKTKEYKESEARTTGERMTAGKGCRANVRL